MSFDALTIGGMVVALISGGFLIGVVRNNDRLRSSLQRATESGETTGKGPGPR